MWNTLQQYQIDFLRPWYLVLLVILPILVWWSYDSLSGLGRVRQVMALLLRCVVLLAIILALAETQLVRRNDRLTVTYLLDQSLSISPAWRQGSNELYNLLNKRHRNPSSRDKVGAIVFGRNPEVEIPPFDENIPLGSSIESPMDKLDPQYTDLAAALQLAQATFPHDSAKRVVIISDFNENLGDAMQEARAMAESGISIDVVPVRMAARGDVAVDKVTIPNDVRRGQPFDLNVVISNNHPAGSEGEPVDGILRIRRRAGDYDEVLAESPVTLAPGKRVFTLREEIEQPNFYTYEAEFLADNRSLDARAQNNKASAYTLVGGSGKVLLIEDYESPGEFDYLINSLRNNDIEVTLRPSGPGPPFSGLPELQLYDLVIMANVPREQFTDDQIKQLVLNTQETGSGLLMMGGPNSFGVGGWANTDLEKAMPVDFQIKDSRVVPVGALALIMHASEMAQGNYWQKVVGKLAVKSLGNQDYAGLIHWQGTETWLWGGSMGMIKVGGNRDAMLAKVDRMTPGDMPSFDPAMTLAHTAFLELDNTVKPAVKHMIIISDGDPTPPSPGVLSALVKMKVKISTVAIGSHGAVGNGVMGITMQDIATRTGGKYYEVSNPNLLPRIYQREARRVSRPLIYEDAGGFQPQVQFNHEMIKGVNDSLPPITGYVLTTVKEHPSVEVPLLSPKPGDPKYGTILAGWQYGLGKAVVFTTDAGKRWATQWTGWEDYDKLFSQIVRWSMRPVGDQGKFTVATDLRDGKLQVVVTALNKDDTFLNFLDMSGSVVTPDLEAGPVSLEMRQVAPGRYLGEIPAEDAGSYLVTILPGADRGILRTGASVPYSPEFRQQDVNEGLMHQLAELVANEGKPGEVYDEIESPDDLDAVLDRNPFRHDLAPATSSQDIWHLLMLGACCVFFADIFVRRVNINFAWVVPALVWSRDKIRGVPLKPEDTQYMDRLRSRKAQVSDTLDQRRSAARFEPQGEKDIDARDVETSELDSALGAPAGANKPTKPRPGTDGAAGSGAAPEKEEEDYTARLLKAKKKVWEDRKE